jgi:bifunctional pyridoxal-dependent enzyme with beta-cystathionase and maltose regulon repressor activities
MQETSKSIWDKYLQHCYISSKSYLLLSAELVISVQEIRKIDTSKMKNYKNGMNNFQFVKQQNFFSGKKTYLQKLYRIININLKMFLSSYH